MKNSFFLFLFLILGCNNYDLLIKEKGISILIEAKENIDIDPRGDKNPIIKMKIIGRWN